MAWQLRGRLGRQRVNLDEMDVIDANVEDVRFLQASRHGEVLIPLELVEDFAGELDGRAEAVVARLRSGEPLGLALVHEDVEVGARRLLLGHFVSDELADGLDRHYLYSAAGNDEAAFMAEQAIDEVLASMARVRQRAQKIGAFALIPFVAMLIVHGVNDKVPLFLASFVGFVAALPAIWYIPKMRRLALRETALEYAEYYFLFPLFVSITLLTSAGFFDAMQGLIHTGIATLGHAHVAFAQFLGATFHRGGLRVPRPARSGHQRAEVLRHGADLRLRARRLLDAHRVRPVGRCLRLHSARRGRALHAGPVDQGDDPRHRPDSGAHGSTDLLDSTSVDPIASLILSLAIILVAAKVGGHFATRIGQPPVLGELGAGLIIGNLTLAGYSGLNHLKTDASIDMLSRLGVILLLFQIGLESTVAQMPGSCPAPASTHTFFSARR